MQVSELKLLTGITLTGSVDPEMIKSFDNAVKDRFKGENKPDRIVLIATSTGGSCSYSWGMFERIRLLQKTIDVSFLALGTLMSAGIHLMLAVPKEKRIATPYTRILIHNVQRNDTLPMKNTIEAMEAHVNELQSDLEDHKTYKRFQLERLAKDLNMEYQEVEKRMNPGWYLWGHEAHQLGLVGSLLDLD